MLPLRLDPAIRLPAVLMLLLLAGAAAQLLLDRAAPEPVAAIGTAGLVRPAVPAAARVVPAPALAERPLFGRLSTTGGAEVVSPLGGVTVAGLVGRRGRRAAVVITPNAPLRYVAIGGSVAGWQLVALDAEAASFQRGGETIRVTYGTSAPDVAEATDSEQETESQDE